MRTDWTIETDDEAEKRRLSGAIDGRFQICCPVSGLIDVADTLGEAFDIGDRYETRKMPDGSLFCGEPFHVEVYDRMARKGQPRLWRRQNDCDDKTCYGHWKVIEYRA